MNVKIFRCQETESRLTLVNIKMNCGGSKRHIREGSMKSVEIWIGKISRDSVESSSLYMCKLTVIHHRRMDCECEWVSVSVVALGQLLLSGSYKILFSGFLKFKCLPALFYARVRVRACRRTLMYQREQLQLPIRNICHLGTPRTYHIQKKKHTWYTTHTHPHRRHYKCITIQAMYV
jgi:hypothetical protein